MNAERHQLTDEIEARQKNTVFPDTVGNSRNVDAYLLMGDRNAPLVQRIGAGLFGLFFLLAGAACFGLAEKSHSWGAVIYSLGGFALGSICMMSALKRPKSNHRKNK